MNNTIDWNISRQIVWGIPIPAQLCTVCKKGFPDLENKATECKFCGGEIVRDIDTFDTWFSSGQWPYLVLGYPDNKDFGEFYPTDVMETGHDLIFKWVPRMVFFGLYRTSKAPFHTVYMHGLVNDKNGKKMSKSKGNVVSPIELIQKFGTDALRMGLVVGNTPGSDLALSEDKIKAYKHFANKLWNITRFVTSSGEKAEAPITDADKTLIAEHTALIADVTKEMEEYKFYLAAEKLYHYLWGRFAAEIIEESKTIFTNGNPAEKASRLHTLYYILETSLRALHPFMPFITEELWSILGHDQLLMVEHWPTHS
jgi:valyl-tRNA synthetase